MSRPSFLYFGFHDFCWKYCRFCGSAEICISLHNLLTSAPLMWLLTFESKICIKFENYLRLWLLCVKGQSSSRSSDDAVSHPQEHTGRMVDWTLWQLISEQLTSSDSSGALSPLCLPATRPSQSRSTHKLLLLQPLDPQDTAQPPSTHTVLFTLSSTKITTTCWEKKTSVFQRLTSSAVSQWCSTSSRKSSRDFSPVQRWSSFLSASCSRVGMNTLRAQCVSSACQSAEWTPERWIYCCYRWRHVSLCEHVHIQGAGFTAYDQSQTWTVWLTAEPHTSQPGSNCSIIKIRGEQTHDPE